MYKLSVSRLWLGCGGDGGRYKEPMVGVGGMVEGIKIQWLGKRGLVGRYKEPMVVTPGFQGCTLKYSK